MMEHGNGAFRDTAEHLRCAGITPAGGEGGPAVRRVKGHTVTLLAGSTVREPRKGCLYPWMESPEELLPAIREVRDSSDLVIVFLHWGDEYIPWPSPGQVKAGRALVDGGADIILGSHPHVLQGYELYQGRPIFYSLGNFIFDNLGTGTRQSVIARIQADMEEESFSVGLDPITAHPSELFPIPVQGDPGMQIINNMERVRRCLADRSTPDYATALGGYPQLLRGYRGRVRWEMKKHFIRNLTRYPPGLSYSLVKSWAGKILP
jgi:poly-gamma-glutamate synthesis protein (capsule biosynthesis protein)